MIKCSIHDTNGEEKFNSLTGNFFRKADGCIFVYDITNKKSFEEIKNIYIPKIKEKCKKDVKTILLGNKSDLDYLREVSIDEGIKLALENNFYFKETSCIENKNVADAFQTIIEISNFDKNLSKSYILDNNNKRNKKCGC